MTESLSSRSENEPPRWTIYVCPECGVRTLNGESGVWAHAYDCSLEDVCGGDPVTLVEASRLEAAEGDRDRLRDLSQAVVRATPTWTNAGSLLRLETAIDALRAALSTGDRQEQHLGVRTGVPTQSGIAGTDSEGGSPTTFSEGGEGR